MKKSPGLFRALAVGLLLSLLTSCNKPAPQLFEKQFYAFGTTVNLMLYGVSPAEGERMAKMAAEDFDYMHSAWNPWQAGSLGRVNQLLPLQGRFSTSVAIVEMIKEARKLSNESGGLFNPAIGGLIKLWGFNQDIMPTEPPKDTAKIAELVASKPSLNDIDIDGVTLLCHNPAVIIDFGAFAKGYGVDRVIEHLKKQGIKNAIINAGGDLRAIGSKGGQPWNIGIQDPNGKGVIASVQVQGDESVFTSGDYERYFFYKGKRYHHIIDPRTGYPATGSRSSTILHTSGAVADAAATALFVAGPSKWQDVVKSMKLEYAMLIGDDNTVYMTPAMAKRIKFEVTPAPKVVIGDGP